MDLSQLILLRRHHVPNSDNSTQMKPQKKVSSWLKGYFSIYLIPTSHCIFLTLTDTDTANSCLTYVRISIVAQITDQPHNHICRGQGSVTESDHSHFCLGVEAELRQ